LKLHCEFVRLCLCVYLPYLSTHDSIWRRGIHIVSLCYWHVDQQAGAPTTDNKQKYPVYSTDTQEQ